MSSSQPAGSNPKRPSPGHHHSSWMNRFHRKHDAKHHPEQQPLLADEHPEEDEEPESSPPPPPGGIWPKVKYFFAVIPYMARDLIDRVSHVSVENSRKAYRACGRNIKQILLAFVLTLIAIIVAMSLGFLTHQKGHTQKALCTSPACVHAASQLLYSLSPQYADIDPCTHFDQLACQGFEERHDLRPDQSDMFRGTLMAEEAEVTLRHILETDPSGIDSADADNFGKLKANYDACMDESTVKAQGLRPLKQMVDHIKSIYSVSRETNMWRASPILQTVAGLSSPSKELAKAYLYMVSNGVGALTYVFVGADDKDPETQAVFASPPRSPGLPSKEYYDDTKIVASYQEMIAAVLPHFVEEPSNHTLWKHQLGKTAKTVSDLAAGIVKFESSLAKATPPEEDLNDITKSYNKMTISKVKKALPQLPLGEVISELAPKGAMPDDIIVASPDYLRAVSTLLDTTSEAVVQAFLIWKTVQNCAYRVEDDALKPLKRFNNRIRGQEPDAAPERWRRCISDADGNLGWILSKFFVDKAFSPESKKFGDQIVSDIKGSFVDFLKKASWMTGDNRDRAITKVHAIDQKIGYPTSNPDILDPSALKKYYQTLKINNNTFFDNAVHANLFATKEQWSKLGKPTRHDEWGMTVPTVNAYYNPAGNEIVFPAGIMQSPVFYDPSVPQYLSYGAFGAVSGHELSHAFDNSGSQYDESGKFVDWWSNETRKAFEKKTQCFVKQYSRYSITGPDGKEIHVNGQLTLGENVADAGGIHAAFNAWKKRDAENPGKLLPGLEHFSKEQLFFLNYANWWCGKSTKEAAVQRIYTDPHAPKWARISGTMANSADFRKAFNCPAKAPTCDLW